LKLVVRVCIYHMNFFLNIYRSQTNYNNSCAVIMAILPIKLKTWITVAKKTFSNANGYKNLQSLLDLPWNLSANFFFDCICLLLISHTGQHMMHCCRTKLLLHCDKRWILCGNYVTNSLVTSAVTFLMTVFDFLESKIQPH